MSDEAVQIEDWGLNPVQRTIANGSAGSTILKGTIMVLAEPNTVTASASTGQVFGGILALDKVNGDGSTTTSCHMGGVFDLRTHVSSAITTGEKVTTSGANLIRVATAAEVDAGKCIGTAEETAAGGVAETIRVRLRGQ